MSITLADLIYRARAETNTIGSTFFDDSVEMVNYANDATSDVYDRVVAAYAPYFAKRAAFTLSSSNEISLAQITDPDGEPPVSDFYKELGVDWLPNGSTNQAVTVLPLGSYVSRNAGNNYAGAGIYGPSRRYLISGDTFSILPSTTNWQGNYVLHYVPNAPTLTDTIDLPVEMERWSTLVVLKMSLTMKTKRQQDTSEIERKIERQEQRIDDMAQHRVKEGKRIPPRPIGTSNDWWGGNGNWGY